MAEVNLDAGINRWSEAIFTQQNTPCARFEMRWAKCLGASGLIRGKDFCQDYFEDYYECNHHFKSNLRVWKMQEVRKTTGRPFLEPPALDTLHNYTPNSGRCRGNLTPLNSPSVSDCKKTHLSNDLRSFSRLPR